MKNKTFKQVSISSLAIIVLMLVQSCSGDKKESLSKENTVTAVLVTIAKPGEINEHTVTASGQIEAQQTATISTRVMGFITTLPVKIGDRVSQGQTLVTINAQDIQAKKAQTKAMVTEAEAAMNSAKKDMDRFTNLYKQQSATARELDNVTLQYQSMQSKLEAARQMHNEVKAMLAYTNLTAPFSGVITQKNVSTGDIANPGMPLLVLEQSGGFQVSAAIPETEINKIKKGTAAAIEIKSTGKKINGTISQINPSSQFTGGQYIIKISISEKDNSGLFSGMYANISVPIEETMPVSAIPKNTVLVPVISIINKDQLTGLYTLSSNNTALLRWVRLGKTYGDKVEVLSGLEKNETFILSSESKLYNGVPVKLK